MTDLVAVAIIQGIVALLLLVLPLVLGARLNGKVKKVQTDAAATRAQVENDHPTNLRVEADERHGENLTKLDTILEELGSVRRSVRRLWDRSDVHSSHLRDLDELTQPPSRFRPPAGRHREKENNG